MPWSEYRARWAEYGGRQEQAGVGEAVWSSQDPLAFHRWVLLTMACHAMASPNNLT